MLTRATCNGGLVSCLLPTAQGFLLEHVSTTIRVVHTPADSFQAVVGCYADRSDSRRRHYLLGLVFLAISTVAISLGRTTGFLLVGRLIQGASSASVHAVGMAILADTVGDAGIGAAMGFVTMMIALGSVVGPMVSLPPLWLLCGFPFGICPCRSRFYTPLTDGREEGQHPEHWYHR